VIWVRCGRFRTSARDNCRGLATSPSTRRAHRSRAFLWRTNWGEVVRTKLGAVRLKDVAWKPLLWSAKADGPPPSQWNAKAYTELQISLNSIPEGKMRDDALRRIERLDCGNPNKKLASSDPAATPPPEVLDWQKKLNGASADNSTKEIMDDTQRELKKLTGHLRAHLSLIPFYPVSARIFGLSKIKVVSQFEISSPVFL
jgi:hypothetical protein